MEIKRNIYNKIAEWKKETNGTKALLIEGARRIGKSTVAEEFAQNCTSPIFSSILIRLRKRLKMPLNSLISSFQTKVKQSLKLVL